MKYTKKLLALLLTLAMLITMVPAVFASDENPSEKPVVVVTEENEEILQEDVLGDIQSYLMPKRGITHDEEYYYKTASEDIRKIVLSSETYVDGSLIERGDAFYWQTTTGITCGYNPQHEYELSQAQKKSATKYASAKACTNFSYANSDSNDVCLVAPMYSGDSSFTEQYGNEAKSIATATGGTAYKLINSSATVTAIAQALEKCGVVIFDSHGNTDWGFFDGGSDGTGEADCTSRANTSYLCLSSGSGMTSADMAYVNGTYGTYPHAYSDTSGNYVADGTVFANHMSTNAPGSMLWMAICLGMATKGICEPLHNKGVSVVYGYSQSVTFDGDYEFEEAFWKKMKTGETVASAAAYMKSSTGCNWDPSYKGYSISQAKKEYAAFPIFVSNEDVYPGQGNVDAVQTVYSTWTLLSNYKITAVSNNTDYGTVAVSGNSVNAMPKDGYYVDFATVSPANAATVTVNGNTISLSNVTADCTVTVNFAAKTAATVSFSVPAGVTQSPIDSYSGDTITLPTPSGTPTGNYAYQFLGWTTSTVDNSTTKPTYYTAGSSYKVNAGITLNALYQYAVQGTGTGSGKWTLVTNASALSTGAKLVIACNTKGVTAGPISNSVMSNVTSTFASDKNTVSVLGSGTVALTLGGSTGVWTLANESGQLLGATDVKKLAWDSGSTTWSISVTGGSATIQNTTTNYGRFLYNTTTPRFTTYTSNASTSMLLPQLYMMDGTAGTDYYTTVISAACTHVWDSGVVTTPATCTTDGVKTCTCTLCKATKTEPIAATGHTVVTDPAAEPTCTEAGKTAGSHCSVCNAVLTAQMTVPATGHTVVTDPVVEPTCTKPGKTAGSHCSVCNAVLTAQTTVPATGHIDENSDNICDVCNAALAQNNPFVDVEKTRFYYKAVLWAVSENITSGTDKTHFTPNKNCSRAEVVTFLWRSNGSPEPTSTTCGFVDVNPSAFYYKALLWAVEEGITDGVDGTHFAPNQTVTRGQFVTFLWRSCGSEEPTVNATSFTDLSKTAFYYKAVLWAVEYCVTDGIDATHFAPGNSCTRGQVVTFLWKMPEA